MRSMGLENISEKNDIKMHEGIENLDIIGNLSTGEITFKPASIKCLPRCRVQENNKQISTATYPQHNIFFFQKTFCDVASLILQVSCKDGHRKHFLEKVQPKLCPILKKFKQYFENTTSCEKWPENYFEKYQEPNSKLVNELYRYGRENLAMIHVMIQSPYVTLIKRDVSMTFTSYVANTGGLLGLCLGFSFISAIEMIFWLCCCCCEFKRNFAFVSSVTNVKPFN